MANFRSGVVVLVLLLAIGGSARCADRTAASATRHALFAELQPVVLANCELRRYGGPADGGYLMCANLVRGVESAYSYGIAAEDEWGCQLSRETQVTVHQYDCFTAARPACEGGRSVFHDECVGDRTTLIDDNGFDTLASQIARNGDAFKRLIVKMDIEGAELDALLATPDEVLTRIDQLPMELHGVDDPRYLALVRRLKQHFHLVNLHFNNYACSPEVAPFPAEAYQVLWVNKQLAEIDSGAPVPAPLSPANAPDNPTAPDCQLP